MQHFSIEELDIIEDLLVLTGQNSAMLMNPEQSCWLHRNDYKQHK